MADDVTPAPAGREAARELRLKALLKANMGRRKAQMRTRAGQKAGNDEPVGAKDD